MQQRGASELAKKIINFKSFMDLLETNQSARLALAESAVQVIPTSPEILDGGIPKGWRRGGTAGEVGDWPLLPMIVRFHRSTMTIL